MSSHNEYRMAADLDALVARLPLQHTFANGGSLRMSPRIGMASDSSHHIQLLVHSLSKCNLACTIGIISLLLINTTFCQPTRVPAPATAQGGAAMSTTRASISRPTAALSSASQRDT
jgi:hypothetical protein